MPTYKGKYSDDFKESKVTGLSRDAYYPGRTPNKYVTDNGKSPIQLDTDRVTKSGDDNQNLTAWRKRGGFSGPVSD